MLKFNSFQELFDYYFYGNAIPDEKSISIDEIKYFNPGNINKFQKSAILKSIEAEYFYFIKDKINSEIEDLTNYFNVNLFNDFLQTKIESIRKHQLRLRQAVKSKPLKLSYEWQNNRDKELPELYSLMINKYKLIAPETTPEQFKAVFTGQPIDGIEPIKWIASNRLLAYFLNSAFLGQNWQSIAGNGNLFLNSKGKILKATDLSVAKNQYTEYGKPKGYEKIDLILSTIKKHS